MHTLVILNPGHFHAALVLRERHPSLSDDIYIYSDPGPELDHFLEIVESFNNRETNPTCWRINVLSRIFKTSCSFLTSEITRIFWLGY